MSAGVSMQMCPTERHLRYLKVLGISTALAILQISKPVGAQVCSADAKPTQAPYKATSHYVNKHRISWKIELRGNSRFVYMLLRPFALRVFVTASCCRGVTITVPVCVLHSTLTPHSMWYQCLRRQRVSEYFPHVNLGRSSAVNNIISLDRNI